MILDFFKSSKDLQRRAEWLSSQTFVVLAIQVPKDNENSAQAAEQFFASLHGIYKSDPIVQEHISFEIVAKKDSIIFYIFTPIHLREFIEGQLYAQYKHLQIRQVPDYTNEINLEGKHVSTSKIELTKEDVYPIKTAAESDVDPLGGITAVLAAIEPEEQIWLQVVVRPIGDEWQDKGVKYVNQVRKTGKSPGPSSSAATKFLRFGVRLVEEVIQPGSGVDSKESASSEPPKLSSPEEAALKGIETKITKLGFETLFRLVAIAPDVNISKARIQALVAAFKQYNTTNLNGFKSSSIEVDDYESWSKFVTRQFEEAGNILNIEELAAVYHFPGKDVSTSAISWAGSKKGEAPFNLPLVSQVDSKEITALGKTDFRENTAEFGIKMEDRKRHIYVIGKSGTGKSTLLENMIIDDIWEGRGVIVVDPHGELADKVVESIPDERVKDVVVLDPADRNYPIAFNLLETVDDDFKGMVASGFVGIFKKIFGHSWGPRLEYILRNTVLALLDSENATMLGIPRMLTEQSYRNQVIEQIQDTVIRDFWVNEFSAMDQKQRTEAVAPILNKVGQFLSTSTIRNIVGQAKSTIDIRNIMDSKKILIVNLSKGKIGEDNMALLGAMIITKVQLAAMSRADVAASERPDCFLYVDEFQNFATESFATILSEARKYNLGLTIAHQYIAQMSDEVKDAVIGNVGTMITFRVGGPDAEFLVKEYEPVFESNDLLNLQKYHIYIKLLVDGIAAPAFSAGTLAPKEIGFNSREAVVNYSREHYSQDRAVVEDIIEEVGGYKQKREAENATKKAAEALQMGQRVVKTNIIPAIKSVPSPVVATPIINTEETPSKGVQVDKPERRPAIEEPKKEMQEVAPLVKNEVGEEVEKPKKQPKPLKVLDGYVYKEASQRGGQKWFLGEKEEIVLKKIADKEAERLRKREEAEKNDSPALSEQKAN